MKKVLIVFSVLAAGIMLCSGLAHANSFTQSFEWGGSPIQGEDLAFLPSGSAVFCFDGAGVLTITLTNTSTQTLESIGEALTGITWDVMGNSVSIVPIAATMYAPSVLIGINAPDPADPAFSRPTDLSTEWFFKSNIEAGKSYSGQIGSFGIGTVGDINLGADTYGWKDRFDYNSSYKNINDLPPSLFSVAGPNGIETGIVGPYVDLMKDGFKSQGPVIQNQIVFTLSVSGDLQGITNVQPMFGTDGAFPVPEPATMLLLGSGLIGLAVFGRRKFLKRA